MRKTLITEIKALANEAGQAKREIDARVARVDNIIKRRELGELEADKYERDEPPGRPMRGEDFGIYDPAPFETAQDEMHAWAEPSTIPTGIVRRVEAMKQHFPEMGR